MKKDLSIMVDDVKFNFRVSCIMKYKGKVLVEKNPEVSHSVFPGGRVMTMEDTKEALIREIKEEMHFDISKKDIELKAIIENFFRSNGVKYHEIGFVYKIELNEKDELVHRKELVNYDSENSYYEYVNIDNIAKEPILPSVVKNLINQEKFERIVTKDIEECD